MAWDKTKPNVTNLLEDDAPAIQANFEAIELGTDPALLVTNEKVSPIANIVDTKLAQIATANKVNGSALAGLDNIPSGAGTFPAANLPSTPGSKLTSLSGIPSGAGVIPAANLPADNVKTSGDQSVGDIKTFTSIPVLPAANPTSDNQASRKKYVDERIAAVTGATYTGQESITFPNGVILKSGLVTVTGSLTTVTFAAAFVSGLNPKILLTPLYTGSVTLVPKIYSVNDAGFAIVGDNNVNLRYFWLAMGS